MDVPGNTGEDTSTRRPWLGWTVVGLLALGVGVWFFVSSDEEAPAKVAAGPRTTPVSVSALTRGALAERARFPGELDADAADIASFFPGRLQTVEVRVGDRVEAGAVLARLDPVDLEEQIAQAKAQLAAAQADERRAQVELAQARKELVRSGELAGQKLISTQELETQRASVDALRAGGGSASARSTEAKARIALLDKRLAEAVVKAPFAGRVAERYVDPGAIVSGGARLVRLVEESPLRMRFEVPEHEVGALAVGSILTVTTRGHREVVSAGAKPVTATVTGLAAEVSRDRRVAIAEAIVPEPPVGWLPGMYAEANVTIKALDNVLVAPAVAVLSRLTPDGRVETGVFIADEGFARWVRVEVLGREGDRVGVAPAAAGAPRDPESTTTSVQLTDGARVLTAGHVDLTDGSAIKVAEEPRAEAR